ncbi:MAG: hypothetical protein KDJ52_03770 [Anaerolineae bacterium]|nr:hypothetical protein [Anaerolineae bacterium]
MRTFLIKLLIFMAVVVVLQVVTSALYPPDLPTEIMQLDHHLQTGADVIYLGDSTLMYPLGEITTGDILQEVLPDHTVGQVAHPAYNAELYRAYAGYLARQDAPPKIVIIPINLHSFSPEWDRRPTYQFESEKAVLTYGSLLSTLFYRPAATFGLFDSPITSDDFLTTPVFSGTTPIGYVADFEQRLGHSTLSAQTDDVAAAYFSNVPADNEDETLETSLLYYYMGTVGATHRQLQSLQATARRLKAGGIEPVFYITPVNYQLGERVLGQAFTRRLAENVARIEQQLNADGVDVLNLVFDLDAYYFIDTEHLTENGKAHVAEALAGRIESDQPARLTSASNSVPQPAAVSGDSSEADAAQPAAIAQISTSPTATPAVPTPAPTNTRVVPLASDRSDGQGDITGTEFVGTFEPVGNYFVDLYRIRYRTLTNEDKPVEARAYLYIPLTSEAESFPVLAYGSGTTGIGPGCAPLNEIQQGENWGAYHYQLLEYSAQGFIAVWPNGQGFDDTQPSHPYFIAESEGRTMLDAVRAAYDFISDGRATDTQAKPMAAVFLGGYSSGGHTAFAAKDIAARYAPELTIKGVLGHGPTTNPETLIKENPIFSPYMIYAYRAFYGETVIDPTRVFQDNYLVNFNADVMTRCIEDLYSYYSPNARLIYRDDFREALYSERLASILPRFKRALEANTAGLDRSGADIPVLILQGTADRVVTPPSQQAFAQALCRQGSRVTYLTYSAIDHAGTRYVSFRDTMQWMETLAEGGLPTSSCDSLSD